MKMKGIFKAATAWKKKKQVLPVTMMKIRCLFGGSALINVISNTCVYQLISVKMSAVKKSVSGRGQREHVKLV